MMIMGCIVMMSNFFIKNNLKINIFLLSIFLPLFWGKGFLLLILLALPLYKLQKDNFNFWCHSKSFNTVVIFWICMLVTTLISCLLNNDVLSASDGPLFMLIVSILFLLSKNIGASLKSFNLMKIYFLLSLYIPIALFFLLLLGWLKKTEIIFVTSGTFGDLNTLLCSVTMLQLMMWSLLSIMKQNKKHVCVYISFFCFSYLFGINVFTSDLRYVLLPLGILLLSIFRKSTDGLRYLLVTFLFAVLLFIIAYLTHNVTLPCYVDFSTDAPIQGFFNGRDHIWSIASKGFFESPIYGNGPNMFSSYYAANIQKVFPGYELIYNGTHSLPLYVCFSYGILGLTFLISILLAMIIYLKELMEFPNFEEGGCLILSAWIVVLTYGIIDTGAFIDAQIGLLFFILGLIEGVFLQHSKTNLQED